MTTTETRHWIHDTDAEWESRKQRFLNASRAWHDRQSARTDWGMLLQLLGVVMVPLGLTLPYAFIGSGVAPNTLMGVMLGLCILGLALVTISLPIRIRFDMADPKPTLNDC